MDKYTQNINISKTINYALEFRDIPIAYLDDRRLFIDNNLVENIIRHFVFRKNNRLFSYSVNGIEISIIFCCLFEIEKARSKKIFKYLKYIFERYPYAKVNKDYEKNISLT